MTRGTITRRTLLTGAAALTSYQALAAGLSGGVTPQTGGGIDIDGFDGGLLGGAKASYDPAAAAIFAAMTPAPPTFLKSAINTAVVSLKSAGIWPQLDVLKKRNVHSAQAASINWANPATFTSVVNGNPIFVPYLGYKGDGAADYLSEAYNPATNATNFSLNSACLFSNSLENIRLDNANSAGVVTTPGLYINPWNGSINSSSTGANNAGQNIAVPFSGVGLFMVNRVSSSAYRILQNGNLLLSSAAASSSIPNGIMRDLGSGGTTAHYSSRLSATFGIGGGLTPTQEVQLTLIMQNFDDAVSARINCFDNTGALSAQGNNGFVTEISLLDDQGNMIDAHAGNWLQVGNKVYMYGEVHRNGYHPGTPNSLSGVAIYSNNLLAWGAWHFEGYAFDINQAPWNTLTNTQSGNYTGTYAPKVIYNAKNNNYVLFFYNQLASSATEYVFTGTSPTFGATPTTPGTPTLIGSVTFPTTYPGTPSFYVEPNGSNAYVVFCDLNNSIGNGAYHVYVSALNSDFTALSGTATHTGGVGEGCGIFEANGFTYVVFGSQGNAYAFGNTYYCKASSPLGAYSAQAQINDPTLNANSCWSQMRDVAQITVNGVTSNLILVDQWWGVNGTNGRANQGLANCFVGNLNFDSSGNIKNFFVNAITRIPGAVMGAAPTPPTTSPDQISYGDYFTAYADITATQWRMQTFTPMRSTVATFELPLCKNNPAAHVGFNTWTDPDGALVADLVTLDGSNNPVSVLGTVTIAAPNLKTSPQWTQLAFGVSVTPGTAYGIRFKGTNTVGAFGMLITAPLSALAAPYTAGVERVYSGSTWTTESGRSMMFSTS